jgi:DNA-binding response OmpR family regulator
VRLATQNASTVLEPAAGSDHRFAAHPEGSMGGDSKAVVLIVDDDASVRDLLGRLLAMRGFVAAQAETLSQAIGIAERETLRAVILDLGLSGAQSGLDVLRWLRSQGDHIRVPILILTGEHVLNEEQEAAIAHHRAELFFKPQNVQALLARLEELLPDTGTNG